MKRFLLICLFLAISPASILFAQTMIQGKTFSAGLQFAHLRLDSQDSELMLLINPISAKGSIFHFTPFFEYAYKDDRTVGAKIQFMSGSAAIDNLSLDLMSEGLKFDVSDIDSRLRRFSAIVYHRNYFALDKRSRIGLIAEESLSYSNTRTDYDYDNPGTKYADGNKLTLALSPGIIFFVMNNISTSLTISMANLSYNSVKSYVPGEDPGTRRKLGARFGLDLTGINFEIGFHF